MKYDLIKKVEKDSCTCKIEEVKHGNWHVYQFVVVHKSGTIAILVRSKSLAEITEIFDKTIIQYP